jgi:hypothetical protein
VVVVGPVRHPLRRRAKGVRVERRDDQHECPDNGRRHGPGLFSEIEPIRLPDCSIGDLALRLEGRPMRCVSCRNTRGGRLLFATPRHRVARRFLPRMIALDARGQHEIRGLVSDLGCQSIIASAPPRAVCVPAGFHYLTCATQALSGIQRGASAGAPRRGETDPRRSAAPLAVRPRDVRTHAAPQRTDGLHPVALSGPPAPGRPRRHLAASAIMLWAAT